MSVSARDHKFEVLDGMRGIAALSVMICHFTQNTRMLLLPHADIAVDLFFVLSGFVLAHSYGERLGNGLGYGAYLTKRLIRLYPLFILGLAFGLAVACFLHDSTVLESAPDRILACGALNAMFAPCVPGVFQPLAYPTIFPSNNVLWSLMFEMMASVAFIFLNRAGMRILGAICLASGMAIVLFDALPMLMHGHRALFHALFDWSTGFHHGLPRVIYGFGIGILIHRTYPLIRANRTVDRLCNDRWFVPWLAALLIALFGLPIDFKGAYFLIGALIAAPLCVAAGAIAGPGQARRLMACRILGWLSYPVYCLHYPVMNAFAAWSGISSIETPSWMVVAEIATSLALAIVAVTVYDQPVRAWLTRKCFGSPKRSRLAAIQDPETQTARR